MTKKLLIAAAAFSLATLPAIAGERDSNWNRDVRANVDLTTVDVDQSFDERRDGQEEAWYPGCLAIGVTTGVSMLSECGDAWYPGCLALGVITTVDGVSACANE